MLRLLAATANTDMPTFAFRLRAVVPLKSPTDTGGISAFLVDICFRISKSVFDMQSQSFLPVPLLQPLFLPSLLTPFALSVILCGLCLSRQEHVREPMTGDGAGSPCARTWVDDEDCETERGSAFNSLSLFFHGLHLLRTPRAGVLRWRSVAPSVVSCVPCLPDQPTGFLEAMIIFSAES